MANYTCVMRTNYFSVKDETKFRELMERVGAADDIVLKTKDQDGRKLFMFGCESEITGTGYGDEPWEDFLDELTEHVAENDAIILLEAGHEKLNYVTGSATVITSEGASYVDISNVAVNMAKKMLSNPDWDTECDY